MYTESPAASSSKDNTAAAEQQKQRVTEAAASGRPMQEMQTLARRHGHVPTELYGLIL